MVGRVGGGPGRLYEEFGMLSKAVFGVGVVRVAQPVTPSSVMNWTRESGSMPGGKDGDLSLCLSDSLPFLTLLIWL